MHTGHAATAIPQGRASSGIRHEPRIRAFVRWTPVRIADAFGEWRCAIFVGAADHELEIRPRQAARKAAEQAFRKAAKMKAKADEAAHALAALGGTPFGGEDPSGVDKKEDADKE